MTVINPNLYAKRPLMFGPILYGMALALVLLAGFVAADEMGDRQYRTDYGKIIPGLTIEEQTAHAPQQNADLVVTSVRSLGSADSVDIVAGDLITAINGRRIATERQLRAIVDDTSANALRLTLQRNGRAIQRSLPTTERHAKTI